MSTTLPESPLERPSMDDPSLAPEPTGYQKPEPDLTVLQDRMPLWFRTTWRFPATIGLLGLLFLFLNYRVLWHTDLWGHLSYGRVLATEGTAALHGSEPLLTMAQGVDFVDTAWLSQLGTYAVYNQLGITSLTFLYAVSITFCVGLLMSQCIVKTRHFAAAFGGAMLFMWVEWQQLLIIRPQLAGLMCFMGLFALLNTRRLKHSPAMWLVTPLLFALWANLHGSFLVGLGMLAMFCAGEAVDVFRRTRSLKAALGSRMVRRYFFLTELAAAAVLLNPYGLRLYSEVLLFSENQNLFDLIEWDPLTLRMHQGRAALAAALGLAFLYRLSPRRVRAREALLLVGFGVATLWFSRMLIWWAPPAAYYFSVHLAAVWRTRSDMPAEAPRVASLWTVVGLGSLWILFAVTPFGGRVVHGRQPDERQVRRMLSPATPIDATSYLCQMADAGALPPGPIFNSYEWGDYMLWEGEGRLPVFVASHVQYIPSTVWQHYRHVVNVGDGYERTLDTYGINVVVVDKAWRQALIGRMRRNSAWRVEMETSLAVVFIRKEAI